MNLLKTKKDADLGLLQKSEGQPGVKNDEKKEAAKPSDTDDELKADKKDAMAKSTDANSDSVDLDAALAKSMDKLAEVLAKSKTSRKDELLVKAQTAVLSEDEKAELFKALSGGEVEASDDLKKSFGDDELQKSITVDATGFLAGIHSGITESLGKLSDRISKSASAQEETNALLVKAVRDLCVVQQVQAKLTKSLQTQLAEWGRQPVGAPKSVGAMPRVVEPSRGAVQEDRQLSKSDVLNALEAGMKKALDAGNTGLADKFVFALSKYEATNLMDAATVELLGQSR